MKGEKLLDVTISGEEVGVCGQNNCDRAKWLELLCRNIQPLYEGAYKEPCCVSLQFYITLARSKTNDLDNLTKPVLSALEAKVIDDDRPVFNLDVTKFPINSLKDGRVHIELWEWTVK